LDASALLSLAKMKQVLAARAVKLLICGPSAQIRGQLARANFAGSEPEAAGVFPDLDHGLEWIENQLLQVETQAPSVVADEPSVVYGLSVANLERMEATAPEIAARIHRMIVQLLAARETHLIRVVDALER
jgi:hypothetical protein